MNISQFKLRQVCRHLQQGGIISYPTEAVFGLGCDPLNPDAVYDLLDLKQRPVEKGLILIAADFQQIAPYVETDEAMLQRMLPTWPGPVTWTIPAQTWVPEWLTGEFSTLAVRVTAHPLAKALCSAFAGPLVSTSANPATKDPAKSSLQVEKYFPADPRLYNLSGDTSNLKTATPIYLATDGRRLR